MPTTSSAHPKTMGIDNGTDFDPSWYYSYQLDNDADVPALVQQYSGAGKL